MISSIIFDRHGVLDNRKFKGLMDLFVEYSGKERHEIMNLLTDDFYARDVGEMAGVEFWVTVKKKLQLSDRHLNDCRVHILGIDPNTKLRDLIERIKYEYRLAILSDCPEDKTEVIKKYLEENGKTGDFDMLNFSSDTGYLKAVEFTFKDIARKIGVEIWKCLFVDDRKEVVEIAQKAGMQGHLFTDADALERRIKED